MGLQGRELVLAALAVSGDVAPNKLQPALADGIHLRWAFDRARGFPWFGYLLFRRPNHGGDRTYTTVDLSSLPAGGGTLGASVSLPGATLTATSPLVTTDDFSPGGVPELDLTGQQTVAVVPDEMACELEVELGWRKDVDLQLTALLQQVPVAVVRARGQAGQVLRTSVAADAISEVRISGGPAALVGLRFVATTADATAGWQPVPNVASPLALPVSHPDYPLTSAGVPAAQALAVGRMRYGDPAPWNGRFAGLHDELAKLVDGGPTGPAMADKTTAVTAVPPDAGLAMPAQSVLDVVVLGALHPAVAQMVGLAWVDNKVAPGERWDYLVVADHTGNLGADPAKALQYLRTNGFGPGVDGFIAFDRSLDDPADPLGPPAWARSYAVPGGQVPSAGLRWDRTTAPTGQVLPGGAVLHHVWRIDFGATPPATAPDPTVSGTPLTADVPVLAGSPAPGAAPPPAPPAGWPPFGLLYVDSGLPEGWYGYAISGVDLFGRHSPTGPLASWRGPTAAEPQLHPFAIGLLDKMPPPMPQAVEATALDPDDPTVVQDAAYTAWRAALPAAAQDVVGLRVRWRWTHSQMDQAPDTREFRVYLQPGRVNALAGRITAVTAGPTAEQSLVDTDILNTLPADGWVGTRLLTGPDAFAVLGSEAATPLRLRIRNIGAGRTIAPVAGPCGLGIPVGHPLHVDYGTAASWARRYHVVGYADTARYTETGVAGARERQYDLFLPDPGGATHPGVPLTTTAAEPVSYAHVGVSAADDKQHTPDDTRWASGAWGGSARFGNEGRVGGPATIFLVHRTPPDPPSLPSADGERTWATPADYHGHSYFTLRWVAQPGNPVHVVRAMDDALFRTDWARRPGWGPLDPVGSAADRALFPSSTSEPRWDTAKLQQVAAELNALRALKSATATTTAAAMAAYAALSNDAARVLAGLPGTDAAYTQLTIQALDPDDPASADRAGPDAPDGYVPDPSLRAYVDTLDGRGTNRWFYRALAVDRAHNRSALSASTPPVWLPRVVPPRSPRITKVSGGSRRITVSWASNREPDLVGYRVYRTDDPASARDIRDMVLVHSEAVAAGDPADRPAAVSHTDDPVPALRTITYRVTALDAAGNESAPSPPVGGRAYDLTPPDPPTWERAGWLRIDALGAEHEWATSPPAGEVWRPVAALAWSTAERARVLLQRRPLDGTGWTNVTGWLDAATHDTARDVWVTTAYDDRADPATGASYRLKVQSEAGNLNVDFDERALEPV